MNKALSLALLVVGLVLLVMGWNASDSISSEFSELFSGSPSDKAVWLLIGGIAGVIVGGVGLLGGRRSRTA